MLPEVTQHLLPPAHSTGGGAQGCCAHGDSSWVPAAPRGGVPGVPRGCSSSIPRDPGSDPTHPCWGGVWGAGWGTEPPPSPPVCQPGARSRPCSGLICGAITSQYLLEKSRVVFQVGGRGGSASSPLIALPVSPSPQLRSLPPQAKSERNYHIFYEMLAGLPAQQRQRYCLQGAETYYYLNQVVCPPSSGGFGVFRGVPLHPGPPRFGVGMLMASWGPRQGGNCEIPGKEDAEDFRRLLGTMEALGFSVDEQNSIFRILSSVLHLGNVYFEKHEVPPPAPPAALFRPDLGRGEGDRHVPRRHPASRRRTARRSPRW